MSLKIAEKGEKKEKLGGSGLGAAYKFAAPIPDMDGAFTMVARLELEPGASIGYHKHAENEEVYVIISGEGVYCEENKEEPAKAGDIFLCRKGNSHSLKNTGAGKRVLGASIAKRG